MDAHARDPQPHGAPRVTSSFSRGVAAGRPTRAALVLLGAALVVSCATSASVRRGRAAEDMQDYDLAVVEYTKALRERPDDPDARTGLERARLRAAQMHFNRGRRFAAATRLEEAVVEYQAAAELNPTSSEVERELKAARSQLRAKVAVSREGKTALETLIERARDLSPEGFDLPRDVNLPSSLVFRDAGSRDVLTAIARFANINIVFDPAFRDAPITVDLHGSTLENALESVASSTRNFYRVTAERTITIIPDTPAKRREYEEEVVRTFYLSNADVKETLDLLRIVVDLRKLAPITGTNAITVKDTPERVQAAGRIIAAIDKAKPEVVIDVELLEVDRQRLQDLGIQIASPGSQGVSGQIDINQEGLTLRDLQNLTAAGVFLTNLPGIYYRLLRSDAATRIMANPQLRASEGVTATARFGDRVPVPQTTFVPIAQGGVAQQPVVSYVYENIGVNIDITPRTHHDESVTLMLKLDLSSMSGTGYNELPTFGSRVVATMIRLKDGETSILGGLIRDEERKVLEGIPGFSSLPGVGRIFMRTKREVAQTDIVLTLTPHIVRVLDVGEADLRPFRVGRDVGSPFSEPQLVEPPPRDVKPPKPPGD